MWHLSSCRFTAAIFLSSCCCLKPCHSSHCHCSIPAHSIHICDTIWPLLETWHLFAITALLSATQILLSFPCDYPDTFFRSRHRTVFLLFCGYCVRPVGSSQTLNCYRVVWYNDPLRVGRSGDQIPVGGEIIRTCPDRSWCTPILYNGYRGHSGG